MQAYEALHRAGIFKEPAGMRAQVDNILVRPDGQPCIVDFARAEWHNCRVKGTIELNNRDSVEVNCPEFYDLLAEVDAFELGE